jgi:ribosomal protein S21
MQVLVRDNNVDQALRVLKKKMQREGIFREMKARKAYEKPSERKTREKAEAIRRNRKAARTTPGFSRGASSILRRLTPAFSLSQREFN